MPPARARVDSTCLPPLVYTVEKNTAALIDSCYLPPTSTILSNEQWVHTHVWNSGVALLSGVFLLVTSLLRAQKSASFLLRCAVVSTSLFFGLTAAYWGLQLLDIARTVSEGIRTSRWVVNGWGDKIRNKEG